MYQVGSDAIKIATTIGENVIEKGSKFYEYILGIVNGNEKLKEILLQVQEHSSEYSIDDYINLYNLIINMGERTFNLIQNRAMIYQELFGKFPDVLQNIETESHSKIDAQKMKDGVFVNQLEEVEKNIKDLMPNVAITTGEGATLTLQSLENGAASFREELGLEEDIIRTEVRAENNQMSNEAHTSEAIAILEKCEIRNESVFYLPLKQSTQRGILLAKAMAIVEERAEDDETYAKLLAKLESIVQVNDKSIVVKHAHYNKYQDNVNVVPEILLDVNGDNYYDRISQLGTQSIEDAKRLLEVLERGDVTKALQTMQKLNDFVTRDNNFARLLAEKDHVDFNPQPKRYTSPIGSLKKFYEKNEKNIVRGRAAVDVALKLAKQDYVGATFKVIKEIKREVEEKRDSIKEKEETNKALEYILETNEHSQQSTHKRDSFPRIDNDEIEI